MTQITPESRRDGERVASAARPSILGANLLYLVTMILVILVGSPLQSANFGWGLLLTELGLLLLPALLWFRAGNVPLAATARLRWSGWAPICWSLLIGAGLWLFDSWLGGLTGLLLGYNVWPAPGAFPTTAGQALVVFIAFSLAAPVGEEMLFRGYIQAAYERYGPRRAILFGGVLFALFHLTLLGLPPRLPIAFALGYVFWRSNSILPGIALHAANNALGAILSIAIGLEMETLTALPVGGLPLAGGGLLLALLAVWGLRRSTSAPAPPAPQPASTRGWLARAWPLLVALVLWLGIAGLEVALGRAPALLAFGQELTLTAAPEAAASHRYELRNVADEAVGEGVCAYDPAGETVSLACTLSNGAFEVHEGSSHWFSDERTVYLDGTWTAEAMALRTAEIRIQGDASDLRVVADSQEDEVVMAITRGEGGESHSSAAAPVLLDMLWPWQLSALPFASGLVQKATILYPSRWNADLQANAIAIKETAVVVQGVEPVNTPAGRFMAWRVSVDGNDAWYDSEAPHTLVKYDDDFLVYLLAE